MKTDSVPTVSTVSNHVLCFTTDIYSFNEFEERTLVRVELRRNESQRQLMKRFRKSVSRSGKLSEVRRRRWYMSKSERRRIQKKRISAAGKDAGASAETGSNPDGGRRSWGKKSKLIKQQRRDFAKPAPGKYYKPRGIKATFAAGDLNGQNVNISA